MSIEQREYDLSFKKSNPKEGETVYYFNKVTVGINTEVKYFDGVPEIYFGTFEGDKMYGQDQPEQRISGVDMNYVTECMKVAAKDSGLKKFWMQPNDKDIEDSDNEEAKKQRGNARLRLFRRYLNISVPENGQGYFIDF